MFSPPLASFKIFLFAFVFWNLNMKCLGVGVFVFIFVSLLLIVLWAYWICCLVSVINLLVIIALNISHALFTLSFPSSVIIIHIWDLLLLSSVLRCSVSFILFTVCFSVWKVFMALGVFHSHFSQNCFLSVHTSLCPHRLLLQVGRSWLLFVSYTCLSIFQGTCLQ